MSLFNHPIRGIMPIINRPPVNSNNDDEYCGTLVKRQTKMDKKHDTSRNNASIPLGSTAVIEHEDGGLWSHVTVVGRRDHKHSNRSSMICITKVG